jgi:hypothetical protein
MELVGKNLDNFAHEGRVDQLGRPLVEFDVDEL